MNNNLSGVWNNTYGSVMTLREDGNRILGTYSSHTGSTGTYLLVGSCTSRAPTSKAGQSVAFSIFWRNVQEGTPDESWHWTGSMTGQLLASGTMIVENSIVVSVPFEQYQTGNYVDELTFTKQDNTTDASELQSCFFGNDGSEPGQIAYLLQAVWENADTQITIGRVNSETGLTEAELTENGKTVSLLGFIDCFAEAGMAQSFSFSGYDSETEETMSLSGQLNHGCKDIMVYKWLSRSTAPDDSFMQTRICSVLLTKYDE
ncbi:avidin/streptavidin family protein [Vibrio salinus]|uniref:avidin/streptavidin family protein n=1 Tax=Vibrio salinus TaxID=2899784 RepID=UPI001E4343C5|nr:avidin/streptavidin family protein [Vibrio salinus]MCE0494426.1 avidin/streptavidin family protein [Vibrio salinus]